MISESGPCGVVSARAALEQAVTEALGCAPAGVYGSWGTDIVGTWCVKHGHPATSRWPCHIAAPVVAAVEPLLANAARQALLDAAAAIREDSGKETYGGPAGEWDAYLDYYGAGNWLEARARGLST